MSSRDTDETPTISFLISNKKKRLLVIDGYIHQQNKSTARVSYWLCEIKLCNTGVHLNSDDRFLKYTENPHTHMPNQVSSNFEFRFNPSTNITLHSPLFSDLIDFHKKRIRKQVLYISLIFGIFGLLGLILLLTSFAIPNCNNYIDHCSNTRLTLLVFGASSLGTAVLITFIVVCVTRYQVHKQFGDFDNSTSLGQTSVWRLDGAEWIRYLNYIYGPDRQWTQLAPLSSFCCRRQSYDRLLNRQYGHIVFYSNGFIIDELYFIPFRLYSLQGIELLNIDQNSPTLGLRIHTYMKAGEHSRNVYFDLFAPSSITQEQLLTIARSYGTTVFGLNQTNVPLSGLPIAT
ncbi:unnamed protein product [Rotaria magnacalcarata]|uniref:FLYWCH-type domain-containing protein n=1 Tax=Rotaria magnacalcarata TaxID=392030 RepID=A0A8S2R5A7_9BILA|nr:unnamed protein product [Rotaria magnacalcarata]